MRREASYLRDIITAAASIERIAKGRSENEFLSDEALPAAVLHYLTVIGEAMNRLSLELRAKYPEVPWTQIVAVRNRIVHAYFDLDWRILWTSAVDEIPKLREQIVRILEAEFPDQGSLS